MHRRRNLILNLAILVSIAATCAGLWAYFNRPVATPAWPENVWGYSFSPFRAGQDPTRNVYPSEQEIAADIEMLAEQTNRLRTYSVRDSLGEIPRIAQEYGMNVTLGVWISSDLVANEYEINRAIDIANRERNIDLVMVGNEAVYRGDVTPEQLSAYIDRVRDNVKTLVITAEPWHIWMKYPELADNVKVIGAHVLVYWEKEPSEFAVQGTIERAKLVRKQFPKKRLLLAEVNQAGKLVHAEPGVKKLNIGTIIIAIVLVAFYAGGWAI